VAVVPADEFDDAPFSVTATSPDFVEAPKVSTFNSGSFPVFVFCVLSMMHTFLTVEFNPSFFELFLTATMQGGQDNVGIFVTATSHCH
jgi:hypothetical protein